MLKFTLKKHLGGDDTEILLEKTTYQNNGSLALLAYFPDDEGHIDTDWPDILSVNLEGAPADDHAFYGSSDCPQTLKELTKIGFIEPIDQAIQGMGVYTLFRVTDKYWNKLTETK